MWMYIAEVVKASCFRGSFLRSSVKRGGMEVDIGGRCRTTAC